MKQFNAVLVVISLAVSTAAMAGPCERLGDISGLYRQDISGFGDTYNNGQVIFSKIAGNRYRYTQSGDVDIDGYAQPLRSTEVELKRQGLKCTFVDPLAMIPHTVRILKRSGHGELTMRNEDQMSRRVKTILTFLHPQ